MIHLAVSTQFRCVTDGKTDRQTDGETSCDSISRCACAMRGKMNGREYVVSWNTLKEIAQYRLQKPTKVVFT